MGFDNLIQNEERSTEPSSKHTVKDKLLDGLIWGVFMGICFFLIWLLSKPINMISNVFHLGSIHASNDLILAMMIYFWWIHLKNYKSLEDQINQLKKKIDALNAKKT
jgi:hypothetical protein